MMDALGLDCYVNFPTRQSGHSLDLVFTEALSEMKIISYNPSTYLSDHCTIECLLSLKKCNMQKKEIKYRKSKSLASFLHAKAIFVKLPPLQDYSLMQKGFPESLWKKPS